MNQNKFLNLSATTKRVQEILHPAIGKPFWAIALVVTISAPRAGKTWRRLLIISSLLAFAMPILSFIYKGVQVTSSAIQGSEYSSAVAAAGAALGGGMVATVITGFLGFFLGVIFLVIGLHYR
jgi:hypothetical protein